MKTSLFICLLFSLVMNEFMILNGTEFREAMTLAQERQVASDQLAQKMERALFERETHLLMEKQKEYCYTRQWENITITFQNKMLNNAKAFVIFPLALEDSLCVVNAFNNHGIYVLYDVEKETLEIDSNRLYKITPIIRVPIFPLGFYGLVPFEFENMKVLLTFFKKTLEWRVRCSKHRQPTIAEQAAIKLWVWYVPDLSPENCTQPPFYPL